MKETIHKMDINRGPFYPLCDAEYQWGKGFALNTNWDLVTCHSCLEKNSSSGKDKTL